MALSFCHESLIYNKKISNMSNDLREGQAQMAVAWRNLNVYGFGYMTDYQRTVSTYPLILARKIFRSRKTSRVDILRNHEGLVHCGEMLLVLGKPGSGCTTFLKTLTGQTNGLQIDKESQLNYRGTCPTLPS